MDQARLEQYYTYFEQMISIMTDPEHFVREDLVGVLGKICGLFRLAKGVTEFYMSPALEEAKDGEILIDYASQPRAFRYASRVPSGTYTGMVFGTSVKV